MTIDRRAFLAAAALAPVSRMARAKEKPAPATERPPRSARCFSSAAVEATIEQVRRRLAGSSATGDRLASMFARCLPNTLDTTVQLGGTAARPDTFVITGDINAMWLRDSTAQVWPYLGLMRDDAPLQRLIAGVVNRQTDCILLDPYANAFNQGPTPSVDFAGDETEMKAGIHERKWELDSLCSAIRLAHGYWRASGDVTPFDARWRAASRAIVATMRQQQRKDGAGPYRFQRRTAWNPDSVPGNGYGNPVRPVGLIVSLFRPSDDAAIYPFLVPANMFAVVALRQLATMHQAIAGDGAFAAECRALAEEVASALRRHALVTHPRAGRVWAYEVDGYGNALFMDDANVPSLLSLPYLGWCARDDADYRRTRRLILSDDNPWFHRGRAAEGIGSPHTPGQRIWPIALVMRALTSGCEAEIAAQLRLLGATDAGTGFMHEAFDADDPAKFTRPWFAWANTLFGELILLLLKERPRVFDRLRG